MKNIGSYKTKLLVAEETSFINRQALAITQEKGKKEETRNKSSVFQKYLELRFSHVAKC